MNAAKGVFSFEWIWRSGGRGKKCRRCNEVQCARQSGKKCRAAATAGRRVPAVKKRESEGNMGKKRVSEGADMGKERTALISVGRSVLGLFCFV